MASWGAPPKAAPRLCSPSCHAPAVGRGPLWDVARTPEVWGCVSSPDVRRSAAVVPARQRPSDPAGEGLMALHAEGLRGALRAVSWRWLARWLREQHVPHALCRRAGQPGAQGGRALFTCAPFTGRSPHHQADQRARPWGRAGHRAGAGVRERPPEDPTSRLLGLRSLGCRTRPPCPWHRVPGTETQLLPVLGSLNVRASAWHFHFRPQFPWGKSGAGSPTCLRRRGTTSSAWTKLPGTCGVWGTRTTRRGG